MTYEENNMGATPREILEKEISYPDLLRFQSSRPYMFEYANLDYDTSGIANPIVINTWYTALETTKNVKAFYLVFEQTNNGATNETIVIELTIDGTVYTFSGSAASGDPRYVSFDANGDISVQGSIEQILALDLDQSAPLETRSLSIRVRQTTAVDVVSAVIEVNMVYATLEVSN
jgi:hypothetical protein